MGSENGENFWALFFSFFPFFLVGEGIPGFHLENEGELVVLMFEICFKGAIFLGGFAFARLVCERI